MHPLLAPASEPARPVRFVDEEAWPRVAEDLPAPARTFAKAQSFEGKAGTHCLLPDAHGELDRVLFGLDGSKERADPFLPGKLAALLPDGAYRFETDPPEPTLATLAWILGAYRFERYKKRPSKAARLVLPEGVDAGEVSRIAMAAAASRDLINTPAGDLGPDGIEAAARMLSRQGERPSPHRRGRSPRAQLSHDPRHGLARHAARLIDVTWGRDDHPKVTLVGGGVAFDTGGLNIKPDCAPCPDEEGHGRRRCYGAGRHDHGREPSRAPAPSSRRSRTPFRARPAPRRAPAGRA